jgi:8-oxo-dGTP diphosphatase
VTRLQSRTSVVVCTDVVLFGIHQDRLEVSLRPTPDGPWRLPGGPIGDDEDLDAAARRHLHALIGERRAYLEQLCTFGRRAGEDGAGRMISIAYFALAPLEERAEEDESQGWRWFGVEALPETTCDHDAVVNTAHRRLAAKLGYSTIALQFMPERFTLSALQGVYEAILGGPVDKRNFRKRVLALDCLEPLDELARSGNHRPARLYRAKRPDRVEFLT